MKKSIGIILCLIFALLCASALADILINGENFPDYVFRECVKEYDRDGDGSLSNGEIEEVQEMYIYAEEKISDLKGIEFFSALTVLDCGNNQLKSLDLSRNTALINLDVRSNQLTSLDVSKNTKLKSLHCGWNLLTKLDVSKNKQLKSLWCNNNYLSVLDVSANNKLEQIGCYYNKIKKLDVSKCSVLSKLVKAAPPSDIEELYGWWTDNGEGDIAWFEPMLFTDRDVKVIPAAGEESVPVTSIKLNKTKATLKKGKTLQLKVKKILPANATNTKVKWSTSNKKVATVSSKGKVKAKKKGTCIITCTAVDGSGVKAICKITVK